MVSHVKTTIEIADDLLIRAKRQAQRENKTLKQVVEEELRRQLAMEPLKNRSSTGLTFQRQRAPARNT